MTLKQLLAKDKDILKLCSFYPLLAINQVRTKYSEESKKLSDLEIFNILEGLVKK